ncbi:MAG: RNA polymerase sigma factor [Bacteroidetes bacterium]|jgi:RNA polymerase sigma-70 factor (ECF subfamily)|nr:RNA polymerase sigma factor [Bacteroidota bacterium]
MTEQQLVDGCIREDRKCQEQLWNVYATKLLTVSIRYCQNREDAEDVLMEAFVKIFNNMSAFRGQSSLETWMRRIVVNTSINKIRSRKFTESIDNEVLHIGYSDNAFDSMDAKVLISMLESLPVGYRMVFNLFAVEGYSHKEIAELLNIDEGTSRSQLAKARKSLQEMIEKKGVINT